MNHVQFCRVSIGDNPLLRVFVEPSPRVSSASVEEKHCDVVGIVDLFLVSLSAQT